MPRWLSWMFIGVVLYMIYATSQWQRGPVPSTATTPAPAENFEEKYPALAEMTDAERWKRALNPEYAAVMNCSIDKPKTKAATLAVKIIDEARGEGAGAVCGETITIQLTVWNETGSTSYDAKTTLALGSRDIASGLDAGLVGIKPNGVRTLVLPPHATARSKKPSAPAAALKAVPEGKTVVITVKRLS